MLAVFLTAFLKLEVEFTRHLVITLCVCTLLFLCAVPTYGEPSRDDSRLALGGEVTEIPDKAEDTTEQQETEQEPVPYTLTAYCPCRVCCGVWADKRPGGIVYTASGEVAKAGVTVAADPDVLPLGTVIEIEGLGQRVVQDTGSAIAGHKIDVYFTDHTAALQFGRQVRNVKILGGGEDVHQ